MSFKFWVLGNPGVSVGPLCPTEGTRYDGFPIESGMTKGVRLSSVYSFLVEGQSMEKKMRFNTPRHAFQYLPKRSDLFRYRAPFQM